MEGQQLSHYQVLERLGGGGMGVVYKALDTRLDRHVALKFLPPELTRDDDARRRFIQEAKAASALDHPNVCTIYETASTPDDQLFIAMGYYAGETLKQRVARGPLPLGDTLDIVRQVAEGLAEAHAAGIVHRDIKPANIVLTKNGLVKILDFGIAKLSGATGLTQTGITLGTVAYLSPEQARGEEAGPASDVWALGVVFYELLTGRLPFRGDQPAVVLHAITTTAPPSPRELRPDAPEQVTRVVVGALEKSTARRYATARELLAAMPLAPAPSETADVTESTAVSVVSSSLAAEVPSIAVLPFADMSAEKDQDYFCEGMAEEIIDALARVEGLRVVARTSAFQFRGKGHDLAEVGEKLRVGTVLEGSVRKAGDRLRINAQLIDVADGYHLWSERYDRELDDIFSVQDDIAREVVEKLKGTLLSDEAAPLVKRPTESLEAYASYMQGRHYRFSRYNTLRASQCFEEAVRHDPNYAAAWAGVADGAVGVAYAMLCPPADAWSKARQAVERALELNDGLSEAHAALAKVRYWFEWRWDDADLEFRRALDLDPSNIDARSSYAAFLGLMGRPDEALAHVAWAQQVDPLSAHAAFTAGLAHMLARRYSEAIDASSKALDLEPEMARARWNVIYCCQADSRSDDVLTHLRKLPEPTVPGPTHLAFLGHVLARAGQAVEARRLLVELTARSQTQYVSPYLFAVLLVALGELDVAFDRLDDAYDERSPAVLHLQTPNWDPVRDHPRFRDLCRRVGLPDLPTSDAPATR